MDALKLLLMKGFRPRNVPAAGSSDYSPIYDWDPMKNNLYPSSQPDPGSNGLGTGSEGLGWNQGTLNTVANLGKVWTGIEANKTAQEQTDAMKQYNEQLMEMGKLNAAMKYYDAQVALDNRKHNLATRGIDIPVYELPDSVFRPEFTKVG